MAKMEDAKSTESLEQQPRGKYQYMYRYNKRMKKYTEFDLPTKPNTKLSTTQI